MLLVTLVALALWQEPAAAVQAPATEMTAAEALAPQAPLSASDRRLAEQRRHEGEVVCENRPRTGSVLRRPICRTERTVRADAAAARNYVGEVTRGSVHEPHPDIKGL
jgi:hypothetical protein